MEIIRAFIAIDLPDSIKSDLVRIQDALKQHEHSCVKWVDPNGIHLTLKFLGNIDAETTPRITESISRAVENTPNFELGLGKLGVFPGLRAPRVIWLGIVGEITLLSALQVNIESHVSPLGFPIEKRDFSPHLTLGRVRENASAHERQRLGEVVSSMQVNLRSLFTVDSVSLIRSTLTNKGAIYSNISSVRLQGNQVR